MLHRSYICSNDDKKNPTILGGQKTAFVRQQFGSKKGSSFSNAGNNIYLKGVEREQIGKKCYLNVSCPLTQTARLS
jgi:hypothetical protein